MIEAPLAGSSFTSNVPPHDFTRSRRLLTLRKKALLPALVWLPRNHLDADRFAIATSAHHMLTARRIMRRPIEPLWANR